MSRKRGELGERRNAGPQKVGPDGLTDKERRLVQCSIIAAESGKDLTRQELGELAGYGFGEVARMSASRALAREAVRQAILSGIREMALAGAPQAYSAIRSLRRSSKSDNARLKAAELELAAAGMPLGGGLMVGAGGGGITIQLVLPGQAAALLTQPAPSPKIIEHDQGLIEVGNSLDQGEGLVERPRRAPRRKKEPPPPPPPKKRGRPPKLQPQGGGGAGGAISAAPPARGGPGSWATPRKRPPVATEPENFSAPRKRGRPRKDAADG